MADVRAYADSLCVKASEPSVAIKETPCIIDQASVNRSVDQSRRLN
jgi:hypothetical protein